MENSSNANGTVKKQYRHIYPRIVICEKCKGRGKVYTYDERSDESTVAICSACNGTGKVKVSSFITVETKVQPFVPGRDDEDHSLIMD